MSKRGIDQRGREVTSLAERRWREEDAEAVLAAWEESGSSLSGFAAKQGVNVQRLSWWRKQLAERGHRGRGRGKRLAAPVSFVPGVVSAGAPTVVLRLPRGVEVEMADVTAAPALWVAAVVRALEGLR